MTIAEREQQILRIKRASFQSELNEQLDCHLRNQVVMVVQTTIEAALVEEVTTDMVNLHPKPRRSGYFQRTVDTQYGRIDRLAVPKAVMEHFRTIPTKPRWAIRFCRLFVCHGLVFARFARSSLLSSWQRYIPHSCQPCYPQGSRADGNASTS